MESTNVIRTSYTLEYLANAGRPREQWVPMYDASAGHVLNLKTVEDVKRERKNAIRRFTRNGAPAPQIRVIMTQTQIVEV